MIITYNGKRISFNGGILGLSNISPKPPKPIEVDEISLDNPSILNLTTSSNHGIQAIITPSKTITFTEMSIYSNRKQTGSSSSGENASKTAICYIGECDEVAPGTHQTIMSNNNAVIFDNNTGEWKAPTDGERIYGIPLDYQGETFYKYTSKLSSGKSITLQAGHHYLIGLSSYAYMATEKIAAYEYETTNQIGYIDINLQNRKWGSGTDVSNDYINLYPRLDFDNVTFKYFALHEVKPEPEPEPEPTEFDNYTIVTKSRTSMKSLNADDITSTAINDGQRLIYLIRHSERDSTNLTTKGFEYARLAGSALRSKVALNDADCAWFGTNVQRTLDTANAFRQGLLGLESIEEVAISNTSYKLEFDPNHNNFNNYSWPDMARYSIDDTNDEHTAEVSRNIIRACYDLIGDKKFALCVTHDFNLLPMVSWAGQHTEAVTFDFEGNNEWLCYLTGVAIVIDDAYMEIHVKPMYCIDSYIDDDGSKIQLNSGDSGYHGKLRQGYTNEIVKPTR